MKDESIDNYDWYGYIPWGNFGDGRWRLGTKKNPTAVAFSRSFASLDDAHAFLKERRIEGSLTDPDGF